MKLYSIVVLYKDTDATKVLKYATDLSSFSFYQKKSAGEFMVFTAKLIAERSALPSRSSVKEQNFIIHCFVRHDKLAGVCVTDEEYQARVAFTLLNKVLQDFEYKVAPTQWSMISNEKDCAYNRLAEFLTKWQNPHEADSLTRVQDDVEETKIVLHNTMQSVLERGERLDDLVKASENLSDQSKMFYTQSSASKPNAADNYNKYMTAYR